MIVNMNLILAMDSLSSGLQDQSGIPMHMEIMHTMMTQWDGHQLGLRAQPISDFNQQGVLNF